VCCGYVVNFKKISIFNDLLSLDNLLIVEKV